MVVAFCVNASCRLRKEPVVNSVSGAVEQRFKSLLWTSPAAIAALIGWQRKLGMLDGCFLKGFNVGHVSTAITKSNSLLQYIKQSGSC